MRARLAVQLIVLASAPTCAARDLSAINPPFPRIANCYGSGLGWQTWENGAEYWSKVDLFIGGGYDIHYDWDNERWPGVLQRVEANLARIREVNPHALALPYVDVIEGPLNPAVPDNWWVRDEKGAKTSGWPGMDRIRTDLPEVLQYNLDMVRERVLGHECFDGVFYDCWSPDDWLVPRTAELRDGQAVVMLNAWNLPVTGFEHLNGALSEDEMNRVIEGKVEFDDLLARYLRWTSESRKPAVTTLVCRPQGIDDDPWRWAKLSHEERVAIPERARAEDERTMRFGLATALMGDGYFGFDSGTMGRGNWWWYKEYDAPLGYPKGDAARALDGTWVREFDGGTVIVNGTQYDAVVDLPRNCRDVSTGRVGNRFTLSLFDGRIYLPTDGPPTAGEDVAPTITLAPPERTRLTTLDGGLVAVQTPAGLEVRLETTGAPRNILWRGRTLLTGGWPVAASPPWTPFRAESAQQPAPPAVSADGKARLSYRGTLVEGDRRVDFTESCEVGPEGRFSIAFDCTAMTDLDLRMWRHYFAFPVAQYAGAEAEADGKRVVLPPALGDNPELLPASSSLVVRTADTEVTISASLPMGLVDHRKWGMNEYLLAGYPVSGEVKQGTRWRVDLEVRVRDRDQR